MNAARTVRDAATWPLQNPVLYSLIFIVVLLLVFVPLSVRRCQRTA